MRIQPMLLASAVLVALQGPVRSQEASEWSVSGSRETPPFQLQFGRPGKQMSLVFDCSGERVRITQFGVTELLDLEKGNNSRVPDVGADRTISARSATMGLLTDKIDQPEFVLGTGVANSEKGWDLSIELDRQDRAFRSMERTKIVVLMTTGYTGAIALGEADQKVIKFFASACRKG